LTIRSGSVSVSISVEIHCRINTGINAAGERERERERESEALLRISAVVGNLRINCWWRGPWKFSHVLHASAAVRYWLPLGNCVETLQQQRCREFVWYSTLNLLPVLMGLWSCTQQSASVFSWPYFPRSRLCYSVASVAVCLSVVVSSLYYTQVAISPQRLTIYLYSAHRAVIFAIAQLSW